MRKGNRLSGPDLVFQVELLELRELLSTVGQSNHHIAEVSLAVPAFHETIAGSLSGTAVLSPITTLKGTDAFDSSGSVIGPSTFDGDVSYSAMKNGAIKYTKGTGTLADSSGDEINVSFTGTGRATGASTFDYSVKGSVKGGAGTFAKARGSFFAIGTQDDVTGAFSVDLTIKLNRL